MMNNLNELYDAILVGKLEDAVKVTKIAVEEGMTPHEIINQYMIKAMEEIGSRFEAGKVFVPNLLMSARAMRGALDVLKPLMQGQVDSYIGKIVIGTVKGDLHDIGKGVALKLLIWELMCRVINLSVLLWRIRRILFVCRLYLPRP